MKRKLQTALFLFFALGAPHFIYAQSGWVWAKSGQSDSVTNGLGDNGYSVSVDPNGNIFATGNFMSTSITFGSITLTNEGGSNIFLVKYDTNGNVLWAKKAGGSNSDLAYSVSADPYGNVFVTGVCNSSPITFDSIVLTGGPMFLAKYDANGNVLWVKQAGGIGCGVSSDMNGNALVTGYFNGPSDQLGSVTINNTNGNTNDVFIAKYDGNGNVLWAKSAGGPKDEFPSAITSDASGNSFITGFFDSPSATFGASLLINADSSGNTNDIFIAGYDANGNGIWAKDYGGTREDFGYGISADYSGNIFTIGSFRSASVAFDNNTLLNSTGLDDAFIIKCDQNGNVFWAQNSNATYGAEGYSVNTDTSGNVYSTGGFGNTVGNTVTFGSVTLSPPQNSTDPMFIVKYDSNGNLLCAAVIASGGDDNSCVSVAHDQNAYIIGTYQANPFYISSDTLLPSDYEDVFVAKYHCDNEATVNEINNTPTFTLSPNPTSGIFTINSSTIKGVFSVEIFNSIGQKIKWQSAVAVGSQKNEIDLSDQPDGIYFVRVVNDGKVYSQKIIKE